MDKQLLRDLIWHRAKAVKGYDANRRRKDMADAWIEWEQFGVEGEYGWGIYPLIPLTKGGSMNWMELLPLHWENAQSRAENFPRYTTIVSSDGDANVHIEKYWDFLKEIGK